VGADAPNEPPESAGAPKVLQKSGAIIIQKEKQTRLKDCYVSRIKSNKNNVPGVGAPKRPAAGAGPAMH